MRNDTERQRSVDNERLMQQYDGPILAGRGKINVLDVLFGHSMQPNENKSEATATKFSKNLGWRPQTIALPRPLLLARLPHSTGGRSSPAE